MSYDLLLQRLFIVVVLAVMCYYVSTSHRQIFGVGTKRTQVDEINLR
jgi:hypothetical protein